VRVTAPAAAPGTGCRSGEPSGPPPLAVIKRPRERVKYQPANRPRLDDLFSTHWSTENRIAALEKLCAVSCVTSASRSVVGDEVRGPRRGAGREPPRLGLGGTTAYCPAGTTQQIAVLHRCLLAIVRDDEVCQRLMTTPRCWPCGGGASLSRYRRRARSLP
jgi:hypothetical protein